MNDDGMSLSSGGDALAWLATVRARTPARILTGRAGSGYRTATQLQLREDHAAALDAVRAEFDLERDLGKEIVDRFSLFVVQTDAGSKEEYLARPDRGRRLNADSARTVQERCPGGADFQIVLGDGLSATAIRAQVPQLLPMLMEGAKERGWSVGQPFVIRHCRVGVLNDIGELLGPAVVVLLIGERPGLATAESLSAYLAYRPRPGHTDAERNLISNIHGRGVSIPDAVRRILGLTQNLLAAKTSGVAVKEASLAVLSFLK